MSQKIQFALCLSLLFSLTGCPDDDSSNNTPAKDMSSAKDMRADMRMDMAVDMIKADMPKDMVEDTGKDMTMDIAKDIPTDSSSDMMVDMSQDMSDQGGGDMVDMTSDMVDMNNMGLGGETCAMALDVTAGGTWDNQSTLRANDDYDSGLGNDGCPVGRITGKDLVYSVTPTLLTRYKVTVTPAAGYNPMIYVKQDCAADACVDGTVLNGPGQPESLSFEALPNQTYYIIVDGQFGAVGDSDGDFTLLVQKVNN